MGQTVAPVFNRTEFAFPSGPAALDQPPLDKDLSLVRELRRRDAIDLQAAGFLLFPRLLDTFTPISEQDEPVVLWPIPEAGANWCRHVELFALAVGQRIHRVDHDRPRGLLLAGGACADRRVDDRYEKAERLSRTGAGRDREALTRCGFRDRLHLMSVKRDRLPDAKHSRHVRVEQSVRNQRLDGCVHDGYCSSGPYLGLSVCFAVFDP
jgi:hypothetical protein